MFEDKRFFIVSVTGFCISGLILRAKQSKAKQSDLNLWSEAVAKLVRSDILLGTGRRQFRSGHFDCQISLHLKQGFLTFGQSSMGLILNNYAATDGPGLRFAAFCC